MRTPRMQPAGAAVTVTAVAVMVMVLGLVVAAVTRTSGAGAAWRGVAACWRVEGRRAATALPSVLPRNNDAWEHGHLASSCCLTRVRVPHAALHTLPPYSTGSICRCTRMFTHSSSTHACAIAAMEGRLSVKCSMHGCGGLCAGGADARAHVVLGVWIGFGAMRYREQQLLLLRMLHLLLGMLFHVGGNCGLQSI